MQLLEVLFLLLRPEVALVDGLVSAKASRLRQLLLEGALLSLSSRVWSDTFTAEVVEHLAWDLLEGLLGQLHRVVSKVSKWHELHDIGGHLLLVR